MKRHILLATLTVLAATSRGQESPANLALGKTYQLEPTPDYAHCTDAGDRAQLTDGQYTQGYFWTQKGTVGWAGHSPIIITLDLQNAQPIAGLSYNTAAGVAGVNWPAAIFVLVSDNAEVWHLAGDLVALSAKASRPPESGYAVHRYRTLDLATHGRFLKLLVVPTGAYAFVDEIEVYRGPETLLARPVPGREITDVRAFFARTRIDASLRRRLESDVAAVSESMKTAPLSETVARPLATQLEAIAREIPSVEVASPENFTPGKHMEAIREGIEDFEYLRMLRDRVEALETQGVRNSALASARKLLDTAADRVTACMTSSALIHWKEPKDRTVADRVRVEILESLTQLAEP